MCEIHGPEWNLTAGVCGYYCYFCLLETVENTDESYIKRSALLKGLLEEVMNESVELLKIICSDVDITKLTTKIVLQLLFELDDESLLTEISQGFVTFCKFSNCEVLGVFAEVLSAVCFEAPNYRSCLIIFRLLFKILEEVPGDFLSLFDGSFVQYVINGLQFPDDTIRICLLQLLQLFVHISVEKEEENLLTFVDLYSKVHSMLALSENHEIIQNCLLLLEEAAGSYRFTDWMILSEKTAFDDQTETNLSDRAIKDLFLTLKKIFHLRQEHLNHAVVCFIKVLLVSSKLATATVRILLDSNLVEFVYDTLKSTTSPSLIVDIYEFVLTLATHEIFFLDSHAIIGLTSLCKSINHLLKEKLSEPVLKGIDLLKVVLKREDELVSQNLTNFEQLLETVCDVLRVKELSVTLKGADIVCCMLQKQHLPFPPPEKELCDLLELVSQALLLQINAISQQQPTTESQNFEQDEENISLCMLAVIKQIFFLFEESRNSESSDCCCKVLKLLSEVWVPKIADYVICGQGSLEVELSMFSCVSLWLTVQNPASYQLWHVASNSDFVNLALRSKSRRPNQQSVTNDFLASVMLKFYQIIGIVGDDDGFNHLCLGFELLNGCQGGEIYNHLLQKPYDEQTFCLQLSVISLLALTAFSGSCLTPPADLRTALQKFTSFETNIQNLPDFTQQLLLYICGKAFEGEVQHGLSSCLVQLLYKQDKLFEFLQSSTLSFVLLSPSVDSKIKMQMVTAYVTHDDLGDDQTLMGVTLIDNSTLDNVFQSVLFLWQHGDNLSAEKLMKVVGGAMEECVTYDNDDLRHYIDALLIRLPRLSDSLLQVDDFEKVRESRVSLSLVLLLRKVVDEAGNNEDAIIYTQRLLRQVIQLVSKCEIETDKDVEASFLAPIITLISSILNFWRKRCTIAHNSPGLFSLFNHAEFFRVLQKLLDHSDSQPNTTIFTALFQLFSILVDIQNSTRCETSKTVYLPSSYLIKFVQSNSSNQASLQACAFDLWASLLNSGFESVIVQVKSSEKITVHLVTVWTCALNSIVQVFSEELKQSAVNCVISVLAFFAKSNLKEERNFFHNSPWLRLLLSCYVDVLPQQVDKTIKSYLTLETT